MHQFLNLENLVKRYGRTVALNDITTSIVPGVSLLVGDNGAGKSTLVSIIEGLTLPTSGTVRIDGFDCVKQNFEVLSAGTFIPEKPAVFGSGKVHEFFYWYSKFKGTTSEEIMDMVNRFSANHLLDISFRSLSMGETEVIQLIAALSTNAEFFVLDEPNSNLDVSRRIILAEIIDEINKKRHSDFLVTSHIIDELLPVTNSIISIRGGEIKGVRRTDEILEQGLEMVRIYTRNPDLILSELEITDRSSVSMVREGFIVTIRGKHVRRLLRELSGPALESVTSVRIFPDFDEAG